METRLLGVETRLLDVETRLLDVETRLLDVETRLLDVETRLLDVETRLLDVETRLRDVETRLLSFVTIRRNEYALLVATNPDKNQSSLFLLKRRWLGLAVLYLLAILVGFWLFQEDLQAYAWQWLGQTAVLASYCLWVVWHHLPENHRAEETIILPTFGLGNQLTLLRGLCVSMMAGFLFIPWAGGWLAWVPALLYTAADAADFFDGYAARKTNHATQLGARLDMEFDGLGILIVSLLAVWYGQLPWWYLLIGLARYFFLAGLWLREKRSLPNHTMPHSWHRRIFAGFQMGFMSVVLWPIVPAAAATIAGTIFALATSASFLRDWLVVVGWLDPKSSQYRQRQPQIYRLFATVLPPLLRLIFAGFVIMLITQSDMPWQPAGWSALFASWHLPWPALLSSFWAVLGLAAAVLVTLGALGRVMALVVVFPLGFDMVVNGANGLNGTAMACAIFIMLLGTGRFSMWQPEESLLFRRVGE